MDSRIYKTRQTLRNSLLDLLRERNLTDISVKEICAHAHTGRVTFYTHYDDKYDLFDDCLQELEQVINERFLQLQQANNPGSDMARFFENIMDAILDTKERLALPPVERDGKANVTLDAWLTYYHFIVKNLDQFEDEWRDSYTTTYDRTQLNSFFAMGFFGFLHGNPEKDPKEVRSEAHRLVRALVDSGIFTRSPQSPD